MTTRDEREDPTAGASGVFLQHLNQGGALLAAGQSDAALAHLESAMALSPRDEKAQNLLGLCCFKLGHLDRAAEIYELLVRENPVDATLRVNLGLVYLKANAVQRAVREFETATELIPEHRKAHNYLGLALAQAAEYGRAREHFLLAGSEHMAEKMARALDGAGFEPVTTPAGGVAAVGGGSSAEAGGFTPSPEYDVTGGAGAPSATEVGIEGQWQGEGAEGQWQGEGAEGQWQGEGAEGQWQGEGAEGQWQSEGAEGQWQGEGAEGQWQGEGAEGQWQGEGAEGQWQSEGAEGQWQSEGAEGQWQSEGAEGQWQHAPMSQQGASTEGWGAGEIPPGAEAWSAGQAAEDGAGWEQATEGEGWTGQHEETAAVGWGGEGAAPGQWPQAGETPAVWEQAAVGPVDANVAGTSQGADASDAWEGEEGWSREADWSAPATDSTSAQAADAAWGAQHAERIEASGVDAEEEPEAAAAVSALDEVLGPRAREDDAAGPPPQDAAGNGPSEEGGKVASLRPARLEDSWGAQFGLEEEASGGEETAEELVVELSASEVAGEEEESLDFGGSEAEAPEPGVIARGASPITEGDAPGVYVSTQQRFGAAGERLGSPDDATGADVLAPSLPEAPSPSPREDRKAPTSGGWLVEHAREVALRTGPSTEGLTALGAELMELRLRDGMRTRTHGYVALEGQVRMTPEPRRIRGRAAGQLFGPAGKELLRVQGAGHLLVSIPGRRLVPLDLGEEGVFLRESSVYALEESVMFENGSLSDPDGTEALKLVHLRGTGRVVVEVSSGIRSLQIREGVPSRIALSRVVGWFGELEPRAVASATGLAAHLELTGQGFVLLDGVSAEAPQ